MTNSSSNIARDLGCTSWNNQDIYSDVDDPQLQQDLQAFASTVQSMASDCEAFTEQLECLSELTSTQMKNSISLAQDVSKRRLSLQIEFNTAATFVSCLLSVNGSDEAAKVLRSHITRLGSEMDQATKALDIFLNRIDESSLENFLADETLDALRFSLQHARKMQSHLLTSAEETLISGLAVDGLHAWGKLYKDLAGGLRCQLNGDEIGYAEAANLLRQEDGQLRKQAWYAVNSAWGQHEEAVAAILNAINGWRLQTNKARSQEKPLHYFDVSCHESRISRETLSTLIDTTYEKRAVGQRALKAMAKVHGLEQLGPWDILACAPKGRAESGVYSFDEAIDIIESAFAALTPKMGEFARMMHQKCWIDAAPSAFRAPGAYCTGFSRVRQPRVFMTYDGSIGNVITLAHELGHAYHSWVMRDMPLPRTRYPMTLAETASIFAETLVRDYLMEHCKNDEERLQIAWEDASSAAIMLCNIPARFEFEKRLVQTRGQRNLSPAELKEAMSSAWQKWYGDALSEYDPMFWASKLHFSISGLGFYNYPYLFGYLFSLGIYARKNSYGDKFNALYEEILCDTGSMSAEDLIEKHLDQRIDTAQFWLDSLQTVERAVSRFEGLV